MILVLKIPVCRPANINLIKKEDNTWGVRRQERNVKTIKEFAELNAFNGHDRDRCI